MKRILLSAFSDEYSADFDEQIAALCRLGIRYMEIRGVDGRNVSELSAAEAKRYAARLADAGISVSAVGSPIGKMPLGGDWLAHRDMAARVFEIAAILDAPCCRVFSFYIPAGVDASFCRPQVIERLDELLEMATRAGVTLCHENEAGIYGESPAQCADLLAALGGRMRCVFDMGNFVLCGYSPYPSAYRMLRPYIRYFHIKDAVVTGSIVPPGQGEAMIRETLADFSAGEGEYFVSLEPHLEVFDGLDKLSAQRPRTLFHYPTQAAAFEDAYARLTALLEGLL